MLRNDKSKSLWDCFKESVVPAAVEIIPRRRKQVKNRWITMEILNLIQKREKIVSKESTEYKAIDKQIQAKCRQEKETWIKKNVK